VTEKTLSTSRAFEGRLLKVDVLQVELASGVKSVREIIRHPGATIVLAQLPDGRFVFVRQFRKAVEKEMLEVVAGTLEPGEDPDACAARELAEETGCHASSLVRLGVIVPAPGYTDERLYVYYARVNEDQRHAAPDEDENVETVLLTADEIETLIRNGLIEDAKTLATWQLYTARRHLIQG
jgi:ADP-ribose pyrophosphatase